MGYRYQSEAQSGVQKLGRKCKKCSVECVESVESVDSVESVESVETVESVVYLTKNTIRKDYS